MKGYDNIRIWPTLGILLIPLIVTILGCQTAEEFDEDKKKSEYFGEDNYHGPRMAVLESYALAAGRRSKHETTNQQRATTPEQSPRPSVRSYGTNASTRVAETRPENPG